jgi:superfamily II DNA/RNA helicase
VVVLDEVDQLLCHQFRDDLHRLMQHLGSKLPGGAQIVWSKACICLLLLHNPCRCFPNLMNDR